VEGADLDRGDGVVERVVGRDDDHGQARIGLADGAQKIEAFAVGQAQVEQQDVEIAFRDQLQSLFSGKGGDGGVTAAFENRGERRLNIALVIDNSDQWFGTHVKRLFLRESKSAYWQNRPEIHLKLNFFNHV
jgi:hypothetical protein